MRADWPQWLHDSVPLLLLDAYPCLRFSIPHQFWTGADFISWPLARLSWWSSYVLAAGAVIVFRFGLPAWRSWLHALRVTEVVSEGPGVITVRMHGRYLHRLPVSSGQFFIWRFLDGSGWTSGRPYSLSRPPVGYEWRRVDDNYVLSSTVGGLIDSIIRANR